MLRVVYAASQFVMRIEISEVEAMSDSDVSVMGVAGLDVI
jgi:hypothetical protein